MSVAKADETLRGYTDADLSRMLAAVRRIANTSRDWKCRVEAESESERLMREQLRRVKLAGVKP